jgi:hypothetical protein
MGPGTHVIENLLNGVQPTTYNDALALRHDIEYLADGEKFTSDLKAISQSDWSLQGIAMKLGLTARSSLDLLTHVNPLLPNFHPNGRTDKLTGVETKKLQQMLMKLAQPTLDRYGIPATLN